MKTHHAHALLLWGTAVAAGLIHCGGGDIGSGAGVAPSPQTDVVITWTFSGMPASTEECLAHKGERVSVTLSATIDPKLHQSVTEGCATGTVRFPKLETRDLGTPFLEATLLDGEGKPVVTATMLVEPKPGATNANVDFFPVSTGNGGAGGMMTSTSTSTTSTTSSSSGGGMGGGMTTTTTTTSSSSSSSSSGTTGGGGTGGKPGAGGAGGG